MPTRTPSRLITGVLSILIAATVLAGCSAPGASTADKPKPTPTATPTPTPELMSIEEAGEYYLDTVCPPNALQDPYTAAYNVVANAPDSDIAPAVAAAAALRDGTRVAAERLIDPMVLWPESVAEDAVIISNAYFARIAEYNAAADAKTFDELMGVVYTAEAPDVAAAAPRIRAKLGLSADTVASCAGR